MATDAKGRPIKVGDEVARAFRRGTQAHLEFRTVTRVEEACVFLDDNYVPVHRTDRLLVIPKP